MKTLNSNIQPMDPELKLDGPYARYQRDQVQLLYVNKEGEIFTKLVEPQIQSVTCTVDNETNDSFSFFLHGPSLNQPLASVYPAPNSIITISDIEGNFNALYSLLISNKVMNEKFEWIFEDNDLVILGDVMDKGMHVTQCMWLIYHLEHQAPKHGGKVHSILGNHDLMNFELDVRYVSNKYLDLARKLSGIDKVADAYQVLLETNQILTDWWMNKNCIEKIGDTLFVHAGISPQFLAHELTIEQTNSIFNEYLKKEFVHPLLSEAVLGNYGPLWYRGLVSDDKRNGLYQKVEEPFVDTILEYYGVRRVVIGHTIVENVSSDYHDKVWRVDVLHGELKFSSKSEALLIEGNNLFLIDGAGGRTPLHKTETAPEWRRAPGVPITFLQ